MRVCGGTSPAVVCSGEVVTANGRAGGRDVKKLGRKSRPPVVQVVHSSDLSSRQSLDLRRPSTSPLRGSRTAPAHRRPNVERIGPDSLAYVGGLTAYVATLTPRNHDASRRVPVEHRDAGCRRTPTKSYVSIWRKRVATYEAFVNRCQTTTTTATASRRRVAVHNTALSAGSRLRL